VSVQSHRDSWPKKNIIEIKKNDDNYINKNQPIQPTSSKQYYNLSMYMSKMNIEQGTTLNTILNLIS